MSNLHPIVIQENEYEREFDVSYKGVKSTRVKNLKN